MGVLDPLGIQVIVSDALPIHPTPAEWARRTVRHGLSAWLTYLGESVGPKPDDVTHMLITGSRAYVSPIAWTRIVGEVAL
jgi:hypothetical protein